MFKNVKSIKNFGIFKDASTNAGQPFYQFNLFYGFNYSGKTTLSRVFRAMQLGEMPEGFTGASFEVDCHDTSSIKSNSLQKVENLRVFNSDYIAKNVNFDESSVSPVLIVGERNIELETELQRLEEAIPAKEVKRDQNIEFAASKEKEKNNRLTEVGRNVAVLSILGRSTFNASSVRSMLTSAEASHDLTPEQMSAYIDIARSSAVSSVPKVKLSYPKMKGILGEIESIMATSVTQTTIAELDADRSLRSWVEEGIERNAGHTTCQFCHNTISQARIDELNAYFSKAYKDLSQRIDVTIASVQSQTFTSSIPDTSQLYPDLQKGFDELRSQIQPIDDSVEELKASLVKLLTDKKEHMAEVLPFNASDYPLPLITDLMEQFNAPITAHNDRAANHSTEQRQAIEACVPRNTELRPPTSTT